MLRDHFKKQEIPEQEDNTVKTELSGEKKRTELFSYKKPYIPDGMFRKCESCGKAVYEEDVRNAYFCCPRCGKHFRIDPITRIRLITDRDSFEEWDAELVGEDPLQFPDYKEKLERLQERTGLREAVMTGRAEIAGQETAIGVMSPDFLMGSMGTAVGEKITRMIERATKEALPVVLFCCSGGARMQEGIFSLMQMAKTSQALKRHDEAGLLYVSVLTDPTTGGVTASFAMLGDVILAEPGALIGFAGARVIRQTIGGRLPEGFQSAEFLQKHGFVDRIVPRGQMKKTLAVVLKSSGLQKKEPDEEKTTDKEEISGRAGNLDKEETPDRESKETLKTPWDRVLTARNSSRPYASEYITNIFDGFMELHGDRLYGDDRAVIGGIAAIGKTYVTVIGQQKGRNTKENRIRNFGMMNPEGYRKSLRLMKQAEKFQRPIILFVDTPGAYCGVEAEERGQGEAIARNLFEMAGLTVPVLTIITGEGGSGGALALAMANEVWMLENSVYSVLSPEGFAAILWKDGKKASQAAEVMKLTAEELKSAGIIEKVIPEKNPADKDEMTELAGVLRREIIMFLERYHGKQPEQISGERYDRFRRMGVPGVK
ncbi:MAG: acetyl-CoA carboxylase carboxyltransferase subunit alpha [Lachnospiraceae bacterium]|nr:acetyl-CoA carboxylase carboxyltransferase subunit alpha [Lachnospiraceae bacterium]